ncbi:MAG: 16S rRNA (guanine(527)-N(7))-methyltransferase RsmG [Tannerella sp.]|jgi:16S rRNA (guanine527-N7)-methyltransferase|nr:16S rRNA (guanine(527)-N(7))-methyltransferase RsmG [Tannerella sp.]
MEIIQTCYPNLDGKQIRQFAALQVLYMDWNAKINVISRKDIENLYLRHVLHSLGIEKMIRFRDGTLVMDAGTGGGFPGIPLAIFFPEVSFLLIDGTGKKIKVVQAIAEAIGLTNVTARHCRMEDEKAQVDFVVSRAVMPLPDMARLARKNIRREQQNALPNGLICLKGGDVQHEVRPFRQRAVVLPLEDCYKDPFFKEKKVIYIQL